MFVAKMDPEVTSPIPRRMAVDGDRHSIVRWVRGYRSQSHLLKLIWHDRVIPFEATPILDEATQRPRGWHIARIGTVLDSATGGSYEFTDSEERNAALQIAAEAMLLFGSGDFNAEGHTRSSWTTTYNVDGETHQLSTSNGSSTVSDESEVD